MYKRCPGYNEVVQVMKGVSGVNSLPNTTNLSGTFSLFVPLAGSHTGTLSDLQKQAMKTKKGPEVKKK